MRGKAFHDQPKYLLTVLDAMANFGRCDTKSFVLSSALLSELFKDEGPCQGVIRGICWRLLQILQTIAF